ncbi:hypothetical protein PL321_11170 [Caloramator sp. mosi_1]|uniref:hypothetical protein n=1 Tax=Caloramator sp. mosi_1 TaxID=3023090 RepID=UPI00235E236C|nr:hypothetical protein [Caloramator sp. mosi_1]WDC83326.1 hypothetical protein PL321_11170 [Caloramator sp. mosi_1]
MENIKLDEFTGYKFLSGIRLSPNGDYGCFALHETDVEENSYKSNLWLYDIKNKRHFRLTSFDKERSFLWLKDGESIIFQGLEAKRTGKALRRGRVYNLL